MTKYFIERGDGKWLADPEHRGEAWTRNPYEAWTFNRREIPEGEMVKTFFGDFERHIFFGKEDPEYKWSLPQSLYTTADDKLEWFWEEGLMVDVKVTEQEFIEPNNGFLSRTTYPDGTTVSWVFNPFFDK